MIHPQYFTLALHFVPGVGHVLARQLLSSFENPEQIFKAPMHQLLQVPGIGLKTARAIKHFNDFERVEKEIGYANKQGIEIICIHDSKFPERLKQVPDAPIILFKKGNADLAPARTVGIVGTRNASEYGKRMCEEIIEQLAPLSCCIISGLAIGIDGIAHRAALRNGIPTIGVLAHGLDRMYPSQHIRLARQMEESGALLSEYPTGTQPDRENFPQRNRIVAAMSDVLVVVETAEKGGARITAELAHAYNREVMAVPGRVYDMYSSGCNTLIRTHKAAMLTHSSELIEWMNWDQPESPKKPVQLHLELDELESLIIQILQTQRRIGFDDLAQKSLIDTGTLSLKLLSLEFRNLVKALPGKYYSIH